MLVMSARRRMAHPTTQQKIVKNAKLKVYPGFPHGMPISHVDVLNKNLLEFIQRK
jgi:hypothetical protein